jgi:hypothetical protein
MKRVIEGKTYNTATATEIGSDSFGYSGDHDYWDETLYRAPKGAYFVAGSGGPRSQYRERVGQNMWSGGEGLRRLTEAEALEWCEAHGVDADTIAEHFAVEEA